MINRWEIESDHTTRCLQVSSAIRGRKITPWSQGKRKSLWLMVIFEFYGAFLYFESYESVNGKSVLEYGHTWGAIHDDEKLHEVIGLNETCIPDFRRGGKYIMNSFAQVGFDSNNNVSFFQSSIPVLSYV